jgi:plastocyanin
MRKLALLVALAALAPLAFAACGGGGDNETTSATTGATTTQAGGGGGGGQTLQLAADPSGNLAYQQNSLSAKAGQVTIDFDNPAQIGHDVCVQDSSGKNLGCSDVVTGSNTTLSVDLSKPGDYTYYCSVDGHEAAGMKGTLTVK